MMPIFIPTFKRPTKQVFWDSLPESVRGRTMLVVHEDEAPLHPNRNLIVCPAQGRGVGAVRQWILDYARRAKIPKLAMVDDDVIFQTRGNDMKIRDSQEAQILNALNWMETQLAEVVHCGMAERSLNFACVDEHSEPCREVAVHGFNVAELPKHPSYVVDNAGCPTPAKFSMEDFYFTLQLLTRGFPNRVSLRHRFRNGSSNAPGGWSELRDLSTLARGAEFLASQFPNFVKVREKTTVWRGMSQPAKDVTIQWKKALAEGLRRRGA